jgi:hypothetical protein
VANVAEGCEADFRAGLSLLAGPDAAQRFDEAVALIDAAAAAGHAEALERRALFECAGVRRQTDWEMALDSLVEAADGGSAMAARQLILLSENRFEAPSAIHSPPGGWCELRSGISIASRLRSPANSGRTLSADPFIRAIPGICSAAECEWLIAAAAPRLERATLYNKGVGEGRTNQYAVLDLAHTDLVAEMVRARIANEIGAPVQCLEVSQVLRYGVGEEFMLHYDFLDPDLNREDIDRFGQRAATFLIYLNDDYEGAETSFPRLGIKHRGKTGDALVFGNLGRDGLPDPRTQHAGLPPTRGEKWLFSQWIRNRYAA